MAQTKGQRSKPTSLDGALAEIERTFGAGSIIRLGEQPPESVAGVIPSGSDALNVALGIGGYPRGRVVEIYGPESSGKTTLAQHAIAEAQRSGLTCAFVDAEHALDVAYARATGVNVNALLFSQPNSGEQALEIVSRLVESGGVGLIVVDSVAALTPEAEIRGEMGEATVGAQARLMGQALRKLQAPASRTGTTLLFTNQLREAIGVMFGSSERQPGGRALKFAASQRLDIRRIETIKAHDLPVANRCRVKVVKNKVAAPLKVAELTIRYGVGIDTATERLEEGILAGDIAKSGSWYTMNGERYQGDEKILEALRAI